MAAKVRHTQSFDVIVLGAGIVGVSTALHLRKLGFDVALVDRKHPGSEASFGHAGIVLNCGFLPPKPPGLYKFLTNLTYGQVQTAFKDPLTASWITTWFKQIAHQASAQEIETYSRAMAPLRALAGEEHMDLAQLASAGRFYRSSGLLHMFRSQKRSLHAENERRYARVFGVSYDELDSDTLSSFVPGMPTTNLSAVFWRDTKSVSNPGALIDAFWRGFIQQGGSFLRADANKLMRNRATWKLETERGTVYAKNVVVAMGIWSASFLKNLGETYPIGFKRGYHVQYRPGAKGSLSRPLIDLENGFTLTPTEQGIRLTTDLEFSLLQAPPNLSWLNRIRMKAERLVSLGQPIKQPPWVGYVDCLPDHLPIVGASPFTKGLWLNFAHGGDGFTLGPITGRLLASMIAGKDPFLDVSSLSPLRFSTGLVTY